MPGVGKEAAGIGQHPNKSAQAANGGQGNQMVPDALPVIVKPPGSPVLQFGRTFRRLKTSDDRINQFIVVRIEALQNGFRKRSP